MKKVQISNRIIRKLERGRWIDIRATDIHPNDLISITKPRGTTERYRAAGFPYKIESIELVDVISVH